MLESWTWYVSGWMVNVKAESDFPFTFTHYYVSGEIISLETVV
jgi:hypothetical protein